MRALTTTATVRPDHTITLQVPADVAPGPRTVVVVLDDAALTASPSSVPQFSPHSVGPADPSNSYRREDIYGDDGR